MIIQGYALEGALDVHYNKQKGHICSTDFGAEDATVVCKMMGFDLGIAKVMATYGQGYGEIILDDLECFGNETNIMQCPHLGLYVQNCAHSEDAGVACHCK